MSTVYIGNGMALTTMRNGDAVLEHSAKGTTWKNHKYIKRKSTFGGRFAYIYAKPEGRSGMNKSSSSNRNKKEIQDRAEFEQKIKDGWKDYENGDFYKDGNTYKLLNGTKIDENKIKTNITESEDGVFVVYTYPDPNSGEDLFFSQKFIRK